MRKEVRQLESCTGWFLLSLVRDSVVPVIVPGTWKSLSIETEIMSDQGSISKSFQVWWLEILLFYYFYFFLIIERKAAYLLNIGILHRGKSSRANRAEKII